MNCEECSGLLIDYIEDILSPEESGAVKEHLDSCPDCSLELEHYREIRTAAREEALPEVSAEALSSISEAARENAPLKKTPFWKKWSYSPILVPTISAAIALSVWFYYGQDGIDGIDTIATREVGAIKMNAPEKREEAFSDSEEKEQTFAFQAQEENDPLREAMESDEQKKPPAESRISPASPVEREAMEDAPAKGMLQKKDLTEEDKVTYRESRTSSDKGNSESRLKAKQPIQRDYAGELKLAQRQQAEGSCEASIITNKALLNSSPPPPSDVQAGSYKSLAECYVETGDLPNAVSSYKNLARVDPAQSGFVDEKLEELKIDSAYMNLEGSESDMEPAN